MVSGQVVVVDHVDVGVPAFPQIAALRQADDLCRLTGDTVNRLFQRVQDAPAGQLAEQNLRGGTGPSASSDWRGRGQFFTSRQWTG